MFKAIRNSSRSKPKETIVIETENGITTNEEESMKIVTDCFKKAFKVENQTTFPEVPPKEMKIPFTRDEVSKAIKSLKNNKSAGKDNIVAEQLKYSPKIINEGIVILLNSTSKSGKYPKEVKEGVLIPLPKPGKKKGPPDNLRPIILLSMLRKRLAICMIRRTYTRFNNNISLSQAAYREG